MNLSEYNNSNQDKDNILVSQLNKLGVTELDSRELDRLLKGDKTLNLIPLSINIAGQEMNTAAFLSLKKNPDGTESLQIHAIVSDQVRLQSIANAKNGVDTAFSLFNQNEDQVFEFMLRNNLAETFAKAYWKQAKRNDSTTKYNSDNEYKRTVEQVRLLDEKFRKQCSEFNKIKGVELDPSQIRDLKQGKTIEVANLVDNSGEKYSGFIKLNLTDAQLKEFRGNPSKAINISKTAIVTPKHDYKVQVNQNNHGLKTEENKFSSEKIKSGDTLAKDVKENRKGQKL
ncbi:DUF4099 domain-containing protein [Massilibacteroides vaginae]|uniref:DUF4099 domain-containing protein n=1 Tax=Massilibacteroides vaginae TaxID=1673718 RepID=UPI000A1C8C87|nr:DUF4099 domain-containing protein [Massilibacteroides vaginae]